jgi:formate dehydrogenase subunit gamma
MRLSHLFAALLVAALACLAAPASMAQTQPVAQAAEPAAAVNQSLAVDLPDQPGNVRGSQGGAFWGQVRNGGRFYSSLPDPWASQLVRSEGETWRAWRNGPLSQWGAITFFGMLALLLGFYVVRGKIRIDSGPSGRKMLRFTKVERIGHWVTAVSFIALALSGINMLYGRYVIEPVIGKTAFSWLTMLGKLIHNFGGFVLLAGVLFIFALWVKDNLPDKTDGPWIARFGGLFSKGVHPPARKFNAGQKVIFWSVVLGSLGLFGTGFCLLSPFTFGDMNFMHAVQLIHGAMAAVLAAIILAHIYIGSVGMEGAAEAMTQGYVDENWAREHHALWVEEVEKAKHPAE